MEPGLGPLEPGQGHLKSGQGLLEPDMSLRGQIWTSEARFGLRRPRGGGCTYGGENSPVCECIGLLEPDRSLRGQIWTSEARFGLRRPPERDGRMDERMDEQTDERMNGQTDGWTGIPHVFYRTLSPLGPLPKKRNVIESSKINSNHPQFETSEVTELRFGPF